MSNINLTSGKQWKKMKAGQSMYVVNPYGTLDINNLHVSRYEFIECFEKDEHLVFYAQFKGMGTYGMVGARRTRKNCQLSMYSFCSDAMLEGKLYTTSRRKAESYVKLLQTIGYPECVLRHNADVIEWEERDGCDWWL